MSEDIVKEIETQRGAAIFRLCEELHENIDDLYEMMMDGNDEEEKKHIEKIISELQALNKDR